jgi:DNA-directed RNA polymerase specialized sigma24 family protein
MGQAEIAGLMALSVEAVESLLSRARRTLRDVLEDEWKGLIGD